MKLIQVVFAVLPMLVGFGSYGQTERAKNITLSFTDAIDLASRENISIQASKAEEDAAISDLHDVETMAFPSFSAAFGYQRYSRITVFDNLVGESHQMSKLPTSNAGSLGIDAAFNVYSGKMLKNSIEVAALRGDLAGVNNRDRIASVKLQAAEQYLNLVMLFHLRKLINDQIIRSKKRLSSILSLYENGKINKSDLLRAELNLSQVVLDSNSVHNDYQIAMDRLKVLVNLGESDNIVPSDTSLQLNFDSLHVKEMLSTGSTAYSVQRSEKLIGISDLQTRIVRSYSMPTVSLVGKYGFNYPNNLVAQTYAVGFIGAKVSYNLSSFYQNRHKYDAASFRLEARKLENEYLIRDIDQKKASLYLKYLESLNRIDVNVISISQAEANYNIINTKYFNQLALLIDLLDADDIYQQSKYSLVKSNINAMVVYYNILFITGQL